MLASSKFPSKIARNRFSKIKFPKITRVMKKKLDFQLVATIVLNMMSDQPPPTRI